MVNITPDDYKIRCEINQKIQDNLSNDKKKQRSEKVSKSKKEWWANLTDEKYIKMCLSNKSAADLLWLNRSENEKDHYIKLLHDGYKKWYNDMSKKPEVSMHVCTPISFAPIKMRLAN